MRTLLSLSKNPTGSLTNRITLLLVATLALIMVVHIIRNKALLKKKE